VRKGEGGAERTVLRHTVTTADRWEVDPVPLEEWAGEEVELVLRADCESADALAFWGGPAVRSRLAGSAAPAADRPQGVVLVIADTLRRDHLDAWGYGRATAPTLRRLAGEGVQFRDAVAQGVWTKVSVPSILTSLYPSTHGIVDFTDRVPAAATTLAEAYRAAGYATFATSAVSFSGQLSNLHQGTEVLHEQGSFTPASEELRTKQARDFVGRAIAFIESHREVPFLVVLHVFDPHAPYRPFEPYDQMWSSPAETDWFRGEEEKVRKLIPATSPRRRVAAPTRDEMERAGIDEARFLKHEVGLYDGSIRGLDAEIGRLMDRLEHLGLADRVVLAFLADHGEEFLEHGSHWHGMNVYGENANVPLALWAPRYLPKGVTVEPTVQLIDVMPTLLELSGLPVPERAQGKSLLSLVRAAAEGKEAVGWNQRPAFTERSPRGEHEDAAVTNGLAVVKERWKLVQHDPPRPGRPLFELFDHRADPLDRNDLAAAHPEIVRALAGELARWRKWAVAQRLPAESAGSLDAAELARLKSLGYVN
jgi:arylsulfatase A-like enzyme